LGELLAESLRLRLTFVYLININVLRNIHNLI
jgi:hypothetical protein